MKWMGPAISLNLCYIHSNLKESFLFMEALLKRREELLKEKQEVEKKLKLAAKAKSIKNALNENDDDNSEEIVLIDPDPLNDIVISKSITNNLNLNSTDNIYNLVWDNDGKVLAVLTPTQIILKSFNPFNSFHHRIINLPKFADMETILVVSNFSIGVSFGIGSNYMYSEERWIEINCCSGGKLVWIRGGSALIYHEKLRTMTLICSYSFEIIDKIDNVRAFHCNNENGEMVLLDKTDGSLTV